MGRSTTGALTNMQCLRLPVSAFSREIKKGNLNFRGSISWENGNSMSVSLQTTESFVVELSYSIDGPSNEKQTIEYQIKLCTVDSNLGKGKLYYFVCPFSGKCVRTLYMGYRSQYFKSMQSYKNRIYYRSQLSSRLDQHNDKYWSLERKLERLKKANTKAHYKGRKTRVQLRIEKMIEKQAFHDEMRWIIIPVSLKRAFGQL